MEWFEFIMFLQQFALWMAILSAAGAVFSGTMLIILTLRERKRAAEEDEDETQPP